MSLVEKALKYKHGKLKESDIPEGKRNVIKQLASALGDTHEEIGQKKPPRANQFDRFTRGEFIRKAYT